MSRSRFWCFTLNNPQNAIDPTEWKECTYLAYQLERGELSATHHYQGYAEFTRRLGLTCVRALLPLAHWEPRRGTAAQAVAYCTKEETRLSPPFIWGELAKCEQGSRTDLEAIKLRLDRNSPEKNIAGDHFGSWVRYYRSFIHYRRIVQSNRT